MKNLLVACEYSGIVRDAFENAGWNAWSCDLLPTESEQTNTSGKHYQGDCLDLLYGATEKSKHRWSKMPEKFDLMIAHPPCTYLSYVYTGTERNSTERIYKRLNAYRFFIDLWAAPIEHICIENPRGFICEGLLKPTQTVEPYFWGKPFNEAYKKRTCLWLKNLPQLKYFSMQEIFDIDINFESEKWYVNPTAQFLDMGKKSKKYDRTKHILSPYASRKERSRFHKGIAAAMAEQWTEFLNI